MAQAHGVQYDPEVRAAVLRMVKDGVPTADIVAICGVSRKMVYELAQREGLDPPYANAGRADKAIQANERRFVERQSRLKDRLLDEAEDALNQIHREQYVFNFGGKDNTFTDATIPGPMHKDRESLVRLATNAMRTAQILHESAAGVSQRQHHLLEKTAQALGLDDGDDEDDA